jgi:ferritin-like metal-binding protein YciE
MRTKVNLVSIERSGHIRFQEHFRNYKYANNKSKFAQHLSDNKHSIGPMENIMGVIHTTSEGRMLDTMEKFYIYKETQINNQINDKYTVQPNVIFETLILENTDRVHITP